MNPVPHVMNRFSIFIIVWFAFAALGLAREPVRLAISGDPAFANEADLITDVERVSGIKVVPEGIGFWLLPAKELEERIEQNRK